MPPIGETLREARMRQGLDIADVEERTKIRAKYLRALENEEWSLLPGPTFVRTFLRTYAEVLGVDAHLLVEQYRAVDPATGRDYEFQPLASPPTRSRRRPRPAPSRAPGPGRVLIGAAIAFVVFLLLLGLLGGDDEEPSPTRPVATATTPNEPSSRRTDTIEKRRPAGVAVRIAPIEPTYACIDSGPGTDVIFQGTLESTQSFRDGRLVRLNLGKRSVTVTLNGDRVTFEDSPEPLGLALRSGGSREIPEGERPCA